MSISAKKVFQKMKEKKEAEIEQKRVMSENKTRNFMEMQDKIIGILMKILPAFTFIILPFAIGALLMALLVFFVTDSLSIIEFFHVLHEDYSFPGLWSIGYAIISSMAFILLILFLFRPRK
ncbi:MAG: hypothetical protein DRG78_04545 [Epsilonproteobacteria bacterium]|nr:MAG: hypothetical protein DRG78_04545 [Campylobacterota bacterium]